MVTRVHAPARRGRPVWLWLLVALLAVSTVARMAWLSEPCRAPCRSPDDHILIFDEAYYINAARVIAGITPPRGAPYANAPLGVDPNSEHPQLGKLLIAGGIELFGDRPLAWRLPSVLMGTLAILGMFALTRAAGGGPWIGLGAAALMAADNLLLVHGRIGTLDISAVTGMIWGAALYLRGRPILAGVVIGVAACAKEVAPYILLVLGVIELFRWLEARRHDGQRVRRLVTCGVSTAVVFLALLFVLGRIAPPYSPQTGKVVPNGPFGHVAHILSYGAHQTSPRGPHGIASYPWDWLFDSKSITYLRINPAHPTAALSQVEPAVHFIGLISPPILLLALPALIYGARGLVAPRFARERRSADEMGLIGLAWFLGTFLPFVALSLIERRTTYLYYMVVVMPGIYLTVADLIARVGARRKLVLVWMACVAAAAVVLYPFTPLP
jgi:dolichyl-phosphate-mannose-protein mannosyltransferase